MLGKRKKLLTNEPSTEVPPNRVTTSPGSLSVKTQIKLLNMKKEAAKKPMIANKFRRSKDSAVGDNSNQQACYSTKRIGWADMICIRS